MHGNKFHSPLCHHISRHRAVYTARKQKHTSVAAAHGKSAYGKFNAEIDKGIAVLSYIDVYFKIEFVQVYLKACVFKHGTAYIRRNLGGSDGYALVCSLYRDTKSFALLFFRRFDSNFLNRLKTVFKLRFHLCGNGYGIDAENFFYAIDNFRFVGYIIVFHKISALRASEFKLIFAERRLYVLYQKGLEIISVFTL